MKLLYCQGSINRKKEYQVITRIEMEDKRKFVRKRAVYEEGAKHVLQTYKNEQIMKLTHADIIPVSIIDEKNMEIVTPYIEGKTIGELLRVALCEDNTREVKNILTIWKKAIIGNHNLCTFHMTEEFSEVFGKIDLPEGVQALKVANFDAIASNIMIQEDGTVQCIDLEWVFSFPVPLDFLLYRVMNDFYLDNSDVCRLEELIREIGIDTTYENLYIDGIKSFVKYVFHDEKRDISYLEFGHLFLKPQIASRFGVGSSNYAFPSEVEKKYKRIAIYGAGVVGQSYTAYINNVTSMDLVGWADKKFELYKKRGMDINAPSELLAMNFEVLLIAVAKEEVMKEIKEELVVMGVDENKIYWSKPVRV